MKQKGGISLIDPNETLADEYTREADSTLETMLLIGGKWKVVTAYYACYNALYSVFMKAGIKSEIHTCSIALMDMLGFDKNEIKFIEELKDKRINAQYYLKDAALGSENDIKKFVFKCKLISKSIDVRSVREKIKNVENKEK